MINLINFEEKDNNMEIESITVKGFRNIKKAHLNFSEITSIISLNGYGKSNLLEAISFGIDFIQSDKKIDYMAFSENIPINENIDNNNFSISFNLKSKEKETLFIKYGYEFIWKKNNEEGCKIIDEWLRIKENGKNQKYNYYIKKEKDKSLFKSTKTSRCNRAIKIKNDQLIINKLAFLDDDDLFYLKIIKEINKLNVYIEKHFNTSEQFESLLRKKGVEEFDLNYISDIPRVINHLKNNYEYKYELLINAFENMFPNILGVFAKQLDVKEEIKDLKIPENVPYVINDKMYYLYVIEKNLNQPISFSRLSDGTKRVFIMLTYAVLADIQGLQLIAFEEPENSIHPGLLQKWLQVISQLVNKCKIVFTSHSPYIIKYLDPKHIYLGFNNDKGLANFYSIKKTNLLYKDSTDYDLSIGEFLLDLTADSEEGFNTLAKYIEVKDE